MISIIAVISENGAIGSNNGLLWHISEDLKYFKRVTLGHTVIMGRKTWQSICRPLSGRRNIVVSSSLLSLEGAEVFPTIELALRAADADSPEEEVFIIGGGEIYNQTLPIANRLYITRVYAPNKEADTFFPPIDRSKWKEIFKEYHKRGAQFEYPFEFVIMEAS